MKVFFGTLIAMISLILYDIYDWFYNFFAELWENRYDIFIRIVIVISVIVTLLFDGWIFWMLFNWAEHPLVITFVIVGAILIIFMQISAWIGRAYYHEWFVNNWNRASYAYRRGGK